MLIAHGVIDDGSPRSLGIPANTRTTVRIAQGQTTSLRVCVTDPAGAEIDLSAITLTLTVNTTCLDRAFRVATTGNTRGDVVFAIPSNLTKDLAPGIYAYDVWAALSDGPEPVIGFAPFIVEPRTL